MAKGQYKYACDECGNEQWMHKIEFARRARPRCQRCGSQWLDPVTKYANDSLVHGDDAKRAHTETVKSKIKGE